MDVSIILLLPFSALVTFATLVWVDATGRPRPRLIWPFAVATLCGTGLFVGLPAPSTVIIWFAMLFVTASWTAFGTIIGALVGKLTSRLLHIRR